MAVTQISPDEIRPRMYGWISPSGNIYTDPSGPTHDMMFNEIQSGFESGYAGWTRWWVSSKGDLMLDFSTQWTGHRVEAVSQSVVKKMTYPFNRVLVDIEKGKYWQGSVDDFLKFGTKSRRPTFESYYSTEMRVIKPDDIGHTARRGWISPDGQVFAGEGEHDSMLQRILKSKIKPGPRSGWIRWIGSYHNILFLDWSEFGNDQSENLARAIAKQVSYPFDKVWIDAKDDKGDWSDWKGPVDDFIKFGVKSRRTQFESHLDALLKSL